MIVEVGANRDTFKSIKFGPGFNVVLAERTEESTHKDTRNGLGKTTLLNIIHFCMGSTEKPKKGLRAKELAGWEFYLDFRMRDQLVSVSRSVDNSGHVSIEAATDWSRWPIQPKVGHRKERSRSKVADWNTLLGWGLYDLDFENKKYPPSFRSLVSYDIRRNQFTDPFVHFPRQFTWDIQVHNAYLLDLNWEHAARWQVLRDRTNSVKAVRKALREGDNLIAKHGWHGWGVGVRARPTPTASTENRCRS